MLNFFKKQLIEAWLITILTWMLPQTKGTCVCYILYNNNIMLYIMKLTRAIQSLRNCLQCEKICIEVRRDHVVSDAIREAKKKKFSVTKQLTVTFKYVTNILYIIIGFICW